MLHSTVQQSRMCSESPICEALLSRFVRKYEALINVGAVMFMRTLIIRMTRRIANTRGEALVFLVHVEDKGESRHTRR